MYDAFYVEYVLTLYTYVHNMSTNHKKIYTWQKMISGNKSVFLMLNSYIFALNLNRKLLNFTQT